MNNNDVNNNDNKLNALDEPNDPKKDLQPYTETRPWGNFERFTQNELSTVKIITVNPHEELSLQYHEKRSEFWKILSGDPKITVGDRVIDAHPGGEFFELAKEKHRIAAGDAPAVILEIAFGDFEEGDIVRIEDKYGRA
jgi:mannose-6-phosphate isomerase-like protein (cupin superfamily)